MKISLNTGQNLFADGWSDYELLDSGDGQKLERFGPYLFIRPEPQALWSPHLDKAVWQSASGRFAASDEERGKWELNKHLPASWPLCFDGVRFEAMPTPFRHLGFSRNNPRTGYGRPSKSGSSNLPIIAHRAC